MNLLRAEAEEARLGVERLGVTFERCGGEVMRFEHLNHLRREDIQVLSSERDHFAEVHPALAGVDQEADGVDV